jgi:hypothetical protein
VTSTADTEEFTREWELVRQTPPDRARNLPTGLDLLRPVDAAERDDLRSAQSRIASFGRMWKWNQLVRGVEDFHKALTQAAEAAGKAGGTINRADADRANRAIRSVLQLLTDWLADLPGDARQVFGEGSAEADRLEAAIARVSAEGTRTAICLAIERSGPVEPVELALTDASGRIAVVPLLDEAVTNAAGAKVSPGQRIRADRLLGAMLNEVEEVAATQLVVNKGRLTKSGQRLMGVLAEIVYGTPALLPKDVVEALASRTAKQLPLEPIQLGGIAPVMLAVRLAEERLKRSAGPSGPTKAESNTGTASLSEPGIGTAQANSDTTAKQTQAAASEQATRPEDEGRAKSHGAQDEGSMPSADDGTREPEVAVADLSGLLAHVSRLTTEVERSWSAAVDQDRDENNGALLSRWFSLIKIVQDHLMLREQRLKSLGFSTALARFPLDAEGVAALSLQPDQQLRITQLLTAELYTLTDLLDAMHGLREPTARALDLGTGQQWSWWEAGAFARVREVAQALVRVMAAADAATQDAVRHGQEASPEGSESVKGQPGDDLGISDQWIPQAMMAAQAISHGLPDAAVVHAAAAIRCIARDELELANATGVSTQDRPAQASSVGEAFAKVPRLEPLAEAAATLLQSAKVLGAGNPITVGVTVPLAHFWVGVLTQWLHDLPSHAIANRTGKESFSDSRSGTESQEEDISCPPPIEGVPPGPGADDA